MKTIVCYGDSNTHGTVPMLHLNDNARYAPDDRWPGVLRGALGEGYYVIEEGLPGRTTVWADPIEGVYKNGHACLPACLETHAPIDLVILLLGTNDLKKRFSLSPMDVARGNATLLATIAHCDAGPDGGPPPVLLLAPPPVARLSLFAEIFEGAPEKSRRLGPHYRDVAAEYGCAFIDTAEVIVSSDIDGIHFDVEEHRKLGTRVAQEVARILPPG